MKKRSFTKVYADFEDGKMVHYVRLIAVETPVFPHGISLGGKTFATAEDAEDFRKLIDEYIHAFLKSAKRKL